MTHKKQILELFKKNKKITMGFLFQNYPFLAYTFRNRISELRKDGFEISQHNGETPSDNYYVLEREPVQIPVSGITVVKTGTLSPAQVKFDGEQAVMAI